MGSACYVYAIVGRHTPLPSPSDAGAGAELAMVSWRELAAVTGRASERDAAPTIDAVLHHEQVVEAVRRRGPALPVRFGTVFRDAASVASALAARYAPLAADLDRLGDKVELSLTALWAVPPAPPAPHDERARAELGAGARYLHERAAEFRFADALRERSRTVARELDEVLRGLSLERRVSVTPTPRIAARTAYLLDPAGVAAFESAFETMRRARRDVRLLLTGPWPPYSFVGGREMDGDGAGGRFAELARFLTDAGGSVAADQPGRAGGQSSY